MISKSDDVLRFLYFCAKTNNDLRIVTKIPVVIYFTFEYSNFHITSLGDLGFFQKKAL